MINGIPVVFTVSRETGQIIETKAEDVSREDFRRICRALTHHTREEEPNELCGGAGNRNSGGDP